MTNALETLLNDPGFLQSLRGLGLPGVIEAAAARGALLNENEARALMEAAKQGKPENPGGLRLKNAHPGLPKDPRAFHK